MNGNGIAANRTGKAWLALRGICKAQTSGAKVLFCDVQFRKWTASDSEGIATCGYGNELNRLGHVLNRKGYDKKA